MLNTEQIHMSFHGNIAKDAETILADVDSSAAIRTSEVTFNLHVTDYHNILSNKDLILQDFWSFMEQMVASLEAARD
jgi:hypothetical protein